MQALWPISEPSQTSQNKGERRIPENAQEEDADNLCAPRGGHSEMDMLEHVFGCTHDASALFSTSTEQVLSYNKHFHNLACLLGAAELGAGLDLLNAHMALQLQNVKISLQSGDRKVHVYSAELAATNGLPQLMRGRVMHFRDDQA